MHQQNYADVLNNIITRQLPRRPREKAAVCARREYLYNLLQQFERADWYEDIWAWALASIEPASFDFENLSFDDGGGKRSVLIAVEDLLNGYLRLTDPTNQLFTTEEAAKLLEMPVSTFRHHVYETGQIIGTRYGTTLLFSRDALIKFQQQRRPAGRPAGSGKTRGAGKRTEPQP